MQHLLATLEAGLDEFTLQLGAVSTQVTALVSDSNTVIMVAAILATVITVVSALWQLYKWIHGSGDAKAVVLHSAHRVTRTIGKHATPVRWGTVMDAASGLPLPFARVDLLDERGSVTARSVADSNGTYGFIIPASILVSRGDVLGVHAEKNGYFDFTSKYSIVAGDYIHRTVIPMERRSEFERAAVMQDGPAVGTFITAAFWIGVVAVPLVYFLEPGSMSSTMIALFGAGALVRAIGSAPN